MLGVVGKGSPSSPGKKKIYIYIYIYNDLTDTELNGFDTCVLLYTVLLAFYYCEKMYKNILNTKF